MENVSFCPLSFTVPLHDLACAISIKFKLFPNHHAQNEYISPHLLLYPKLESLLDKNKEEKSCAFVVVYSDCPAVMLVNRVSREEGLFMVLFHPRRTMQKEDYSINLTTFIIPAPLLDLYSGNYLSISMLLPL